MHLRSRKRGGYVKSQTKSWIPRRLSKILGDLSGDPRRCHRIAPKVYQFCSFGEMVEAGDFEGEVAGRVRVGGVR